MAKTPLAGAADSLAAKRERERRMVALMVSIHCHGAHGTPGRPSADDPTLCPQCQELLRYADARIAHCPRMEQKSFCSVCPRPCYAKAMQERMRQVMRYAGPRMLLYRPGAALAHVGVALRHRLRRALERRQDVSRVGGQTL